MQLAASVLSDKLRAALAEYAHDVFEKDHATLLFHQSPPSTMLNLGTMTQLVKIFMSNPISARSNVVGRLDKG